jgi:hypothetical protein
MNGYIFSHVPYNGKSTTDSLVPPDLLLTSQLVIHLVQMLQLQTGGMGFHVFDRFYTSPQLAVELHKMKIHTPGTVMMSQKRLSYWAQKNKTWKS